MRKLIKNKVKKVTRLMQEQHGRCFYCNCKFDNNNKLKYATLDHIEPYCKVGNNTIYVLACKRCNLLKGDISQELFEDGYICCNIKPGYDMQSYNKAIKVRNKIKWYQKLFPEIFSWNKKYYNRTIKLYEN